MILDSIFQILDLGFSSKFVQFGFGF